MEMTRSCLDLGTGTVLRVPSGKAWRDFTPQDQFELDIMDLCRRVVKVFKMSKHDWDDDDADFYDWVMGGRPK